MVSLLKLSKQFLRDFLPLTAGAIVAISLIDLTFLGGSLLIENLISFAGDNSQSLSVLISGLLLIAYLLQFHSQRLQHEIMKRQETLMNAGYTPILGVTSQRFGHQELDPPSDPVEENRLFLDIVNNGNSAARDLRVLFAISYDGSLSGEILPLVRSNEVILTREKQGSWWPTDTGGALSNSPSSPTLFNCDPKLLCREPGLLRSPLERVQGSKLLRWPIKDSDEPGIVQLPVNGDAIQFQIPLKIEYKEIPIGQALELLEEHNVSQFRLAIVLRYKTTVGTNERVPLTGYKDKTGNINDDYLLHLASEHETEAEQYLQDAK